MNLGTVKRIIRNYLAEQGVSHLREQVLMDAINDARMQWWNNVEYPRTYEELTLPAGLSYVDLGTRFIDAIEAVYMTDLSTRLVRLERNDIDGINSGTAIPPETVTPYGYYHEEVLTSGSVRKRLYIYSRYGLYTDTSDNTILFYYTGGPTEYAAGSAEEARILEIPDVYCYDLKYFAAFIHYTRTGDKKSAAANYALWEKTGLWAYMMMNANKQDADKRILDKMLELKQEYIDSY